MTTTDSTTWEPCVWTELSGNQTNNSKGTTMSTIKTKKDALAALAAIAATYPGTEIGNLAARSQRGPIPGDEWVLVIMFDVRSDRRYGVVSIARRLQRLIDDGTSAEVVS